MEKRIKYKKEFDWLINKKKFQVFVFSSPAYVPFNFAVHTWIVINKKGVVDRWEVWEHANSIKTSWGHVCKNLASPSLGMNKYFWRLYPRFESRIIGYIDGSDAKKIIDFVNRNAKEYPFRNKYRYYPGPNSNTFIQWILNNFPNLNLKLPWNAFGKGW